MNAVEPYVPPTKISRPKFVGKHKSETNFQKFSNTYPTIVDDHFAVHVTCDDVTLTGLHELLPVLESSDGLFLPSPNMAQPDSNSVRLRLQAELGSESPQH